jgi:predicted dehydrogenase
VWEKLPDGDAGTPGIFRPQCGHLNRGVTLIVARPDWRPRKTGGFPRRTSDGFAPLAGSGSAGGQALFETNGTYAETTAFIDAVRARRPLWPTPGDVLPGMELCDLAARSASGLRR